MKTSRGFSTLEMLIAMTVLLLAFSATMLLLPGIQDNSVDTEIAVEALNLVEGMLEKQQALARKDFKLVVGTTSAETIDGLTYQKTIDAHSTDYFTKEVTATVTWGGMHNRAQTMSLKTVVSNFEEAMGGDTCDSILSGNWGLPQKTDVLLGSLVALNSGTDSGSPYPISDIDVFRKRGYVSVAGTSQNTGVQNPGSSANVSTVGTLAWSSPGNVSTSNNQDATRTMSGLASTNYLRASNFGLNVPKGATILGITVDIERSRTSGSNSINIIDSEVRLVKADGSIGSTNKASGSSWPTSDSYATYGNSSDLWGESWTASDINDSDFGVVLSAKGTSSFGTNRTAQVDHMRVTVHYVRQFYVLNLNTPTSPTRVGELLTAPSLNPVSAGFNAVVVATSTTYGSYAFVATNSTATQVEVIDVSGTNPTIVTNYTIPNASGVIANTIFYKDGYVYVGLANNTSGGEFIVLDVHNPLSIPLPLATYEVGAGVNSIYVKGGIAYLGTSDSSRELIMLDLQDLAHPALRGSYDASGASGSGYGKNLYTVGDTVYLGRYYNLTSGREFSVINSATANPSLLGDYDIGPNSGSPFGIYGLIVRDTLAFALTGSQSNGGRFQILNVQNPASISAGTSLTLPNSGSGVALDCESNYFYATSVPTSGSNANKGSISIITAP